MYRAQIERALAQKLKVQAVVYITQKYSAYVDANHAVPPVVLTPAVKVLYARSMPALCPLYGPPLWLLYGSPLWLTPQIPSCGTAMATP